MSTHGGGPRARAGGSGGPPKAKPTAATRNAQATATGEKTARVQQIPVSAIHTGLNPREHFDQEAIRELADSIREHGLLQPISVRPHNGGYQLIAGERRYRAMQQLGRETVPAIVHRVSEEKARELALIENINRVDMRPSETGKAYQQLQARGLSVQQIAERTGKSAASIQQHLALVGMADPIQKAVDDGRLPQSLVRDLARLSSKGQADATERILAEDMGVRSARQMIKAMYARENQSEMFGRPEMSRGESSARARYEDAIRALTAQLSRLDEETMHHYAGAVDAPFREAERLRLMRQQIQRLEDALTYEGHARRSA